ncbi:MAG: hypothetical protein WBX15_05105 [Thermoanaerobaculia bacterium]
MIEGFTESAIVIVNLVNPREKFWGKLLSMSPVGVTLRGINLDTFDDWMRQIRRAEPGEQTLDLATMFVPISRVERIFLDEPVGTVRSFSQQFEQVTGMSPLEYLGDIPPSKEM